ncbi:hypothetical protein HGM15179_009211 [Zosterops borbonicus]|uniref:Uncharacterized protein n=1 Tax=Zosterops borbonicus TaxID=364589 RepID=A0A8K1LL71_9PASS|nr:hypothetical protein HGM15179_009211 [Zosterops borbonicus]
MPWRDYCNSEASPSHRLGMSVPLGQHMSHLLVFGNYTRMASPLEGFRGKSGSNLLLRAGGWDIEENIHAFVQGHLWKEEIQLALLHADIMRLACRSETEVEESYLTGI